MRWMVYYISNNEISFNIISLARCGRKWAIKSFYFDFLKLDDMDKIKQL